MVKLQQLTDITCVCFAIVISLAIWIAKISVETQSIPTVLNGIVSSISLIVGFNATAIAITITSPKIETYQDKTRLAVVIFALLLPISEIFLAYVTLFSAHYHVALRHAMTGLTLSLGILWNFIQFLGQKLL